MIAHMEAVLNTGRLPTSLKELAIVRTSQMNGCEYCLASHSLLGKKLGYSGPRAPEWIGNHARVAKTSACSERNWNSGRKTCSSNGQ
jgi:AhpD family alkylhydroperoxidase